MPKRPYKRNYRSRGTVRKRGRKIMKKKSFFEDRTFRRNVTKRGRTYGVPKSRSHNRANPPMKKSMPKWQLQQKYPGGDPYDYKRRRQWWPGTYHKS